MQFLILNKPFRQWQDLTEGYQSPIEAYEALITAQPELVRHVEQLNAAVLEAAAEIQDEPDPPPLNVDIEPWMRLHEPDQPVHVLLNQNHHADFDWLAESQPHQIGRAHV